MKKLLKLILPILLLTSFSSCSKKDKAILLQKENVDSFVYIKNDELDDLINSKNDFVLVVGQEGCSTCDLIKPIITSYIKKYQYIIYWVEIDEYKKVAPSYSLDSDIMSSTVLIFNDGKMQKKLSYEKYLYYDIDNFELTMEKEVKSSHIFSLNDYESFIYSSSFNMLKTNYSSDKTLENKIIEDNINVLYAWNKCLDCIDFSNNFLTSYMSKSNKKLYTYEVSYFRNQKDENGLPELNDFHSFAQKYQFNTYREGKVPSIVTYSKSVKTSMAVYLNDEIEELNGSYKIKNSFYQDLIGLEDKNLFDLNTKIKETELSLIKDYLETYL